MYFLFSSVNILIHILLLSFVIIRLFCSWRLLSIIWACLYDRIHLLIFMLINNFTCFFVLNFVTLMRLFIFMNFFTLMSLFINMNFSTYTKFNSIAEDNYWWLFFVYFSMTYLVYLQFSWIVGINRIFSSAQVFFFQ